MIKAIYGTKDILPEDVKKWTHIEQIVRGVMGSFNYKEIRTPVFEETRLFARGIGEATDIVSKEMYTFNDRSDTSVTLKPEMTAAVVRSFIEHKMDKQQMLNKLFYISPMFRQERPQAGRLRQFHQFGAEALGSDSPQLDAEMIIMPYDIISSLGLKNITVKINSLGIPESRENYKKVLKGYLEPHLSELSEESRKRFETNILRIFDSKAENDQKIMEDAPLLIEYLDDASLEHFEGVKRTLLDAGIPFEIDPKLVRGLDYYTHTTFEIVSGSVGSQSALCGGGRYNLLVEQLGGKPAPGIGFAAGIERILLACENEDSLQLPAETLDIFVVDINRDNAELVSKLSLFFRRKGLTVEHDYAGRSVKAQMREANRSNARFSIMVGGDELERNEIVLKNMETSDQKTFNIENLESVFETIAG